jgi:hypothetical protein
VPPHYIVTELIAGNSTQMCYKRDWPLIHLLTYKLIRNLSDATWPRPTVIHYDSAQLVPAFVFKTVSLTVATLLFAGLTETHLCKAERLLIAYVGNFSSPLRDVLPTQVDLSLGSGHGFTC